MYLSYIHITQHQLNTACTCDIDINSIASFVDMGNFATEVSLNGMRDMT